MVVVSIALGLLAAGIVGFALGRSRGEATVAGLRARLEHLDGPRQRAVEEELLLSRFEQLSQASLAQSRHQMGEDLAKLERYMQTVERERKSEWGDLFRQMQTVAELTSQVQYQAAELKNVLRTSTAGRGRWGEVQLRRVVELAGMLEHTDFSEQKQVSDQDGAGRADLVVYLPGGIAVAVDAKVPYSAYERAQTAESPALQKQLFGEHARSFRSHVDSLAKRRYWDLYQPSCGFSVLFVPGEALLDAALMHDVTLWERAAEKQILLATPSTLIALLRMAAVGWSQDAQNANAAEVVRSARELHRRVVKAGGDIEKLGRGLRSAVNAYNEFVGTIEARVLPQARRLGEGVGADDKLSPIAPIDHVPRLAQTDPMSDGFDGTEGDSWPAEPLRSSSANVASESA